MLGSKEGGFLANLFVTLVVIAWMFGVARKDRETWVWRGWMSFWIGTGVYYAVAVLCVRTAYEPLVLPLYLSTGALLAVLIVECEPGRRRQIRGVVAIAIAAIVVSAAALADYVTKQDGHKGWHQALLALVLLGWAWGLRERDSSKAGDVMIYALVQLPLMALLSLLAFKANPESLKNMLPEGDEQARYEAATYAIYAVLKLKMIPAMYVLTRKRADHSRSENSSSAPAGGLPSGVAFSSSTSASPSPRQ